MKRRMFKNVSAGTVIKLRGDNRLYLRQSNGCKRADGVRPFVHGRTYVNIVTEVATR